MPCSTMDSGRSLFPTTCVLTSMGSMLINWGHPLKWEVHVWGVTSGWQSSSALSQTGRAFYLSWLVTPSFPVFQAESY